jgi:hypothetical protein
MSDKVADLDSDTLGVLLLSAYTPNQDTHQFVSDVLGAGTEVLTTGGTGYTRQNLSSVTFATGAGHLYTLDCADITWASATFSASHAVFYDNTPSTDATRPVICYWDFQGTQSPSGVPFILTINASGLLTFTGA